MGKKSPAPPPAPDYAGAAQQQGQANLEAARLTARLSNPNISTPLGGQRVTFGRETFDQSAYDKAMADYNKQLEAYNAAKASGQPFTPSGGQPPGGMPTSPFTMDDRYGVGRGGAGEPIDFGAPGTYPRMGGGGGLTFDPNTGMPIAPTREQFTSRTDLDTPFIEQYLTPEAQATLEAQQRVERAFAGLGEQAIGKVSDIYKDTFRPQGLPEQQFALTGYGDVPQMPRLSELGQFQRNVQAGPLPDAPNLAALGSAGADVQAQGVNYGPAAGQFGFATGGPSAPSEIIGANLGGVRGVSYGPAEGLYGFARGDVAPRDLIEGIDTRGLARMPVGAGMTGQQAILSRLTPTLQRDRAALENQLRNQGLVPGGEAYNREVELFNQRANDLVQQAALQGIGIDAQMRAQGFNERQIQSEMANRAREAEFGMGVSSNQLYNQAVQQNLAQGMSLSEARNRAQQQDFSQRLSAGAFGREGQQIAFQMMREETDARNRAVAQNFAQGMSASEAQNRAAQQAFEQQAGVQDIRNRALQQNLENMVRQYELAAGRQATEFGQQMDVAGFYNQALAADIQRQLQETQAAAGLQGQRFNQAQAAANFANAQRQASLQEQLALRAQPLNEISALIGGSQIQMPQFQAYQGADVAAAPIFGATQAAGNFAQQNYANQTAAYNAKMGLYGNIAGAVGQAAGGGAFSDRRLKSNVVRVGTHPLGIGIYDYDIFGERQRGVMADELETVKPEAVTTHPSGYKMVYYGMLS